jgi:hypothetical protein
MLCDSTFMDIPDTGLWEDECQLSTASMIHICLPASFCHWSLICMFDVDGRPLLTSSMTPDHLQSHDTNSALGQIPHLHHMWPVSTDVHGSRVWYPHEPDDTAHLFPCPHVQQDHQFPTDTALSLHSCTDEDTCHLTVGPLNIVQQNNSLLLWFFFTGMKWGNLPSDWSLY